MDHSLDTHVKHLNKICRICGMLSISRKEERLNKTAIKCSSKSFDLLTLLFDINIAADHPTKHSPNMCLKCFNRLKKIRANKSESLLITAKQKAREKDNIVVGA